MGYHHLNLLVGLREHLPSDVLVVAGLESDDYIRSKGREPVFDQNHRLTAVAQILKQEGKLAVAFPIPERPKSVTAKIFYERLVRELGVYRRSGCYHLITDGDPAAEIKKQRMLPKERSEPAIYMLGSYGIEPMSVTRQLQMYDRR